MGADDGIFPWALRTIKILQNYMGNCEIIQWGRGFYAWPGFNYGQQNCLSINFPNEPFNGIQAESICDSLEKRAFSVSNNKFPLMLGKYSFGKEEYKIPFMSIDLMLFYRELIKLSTRRIISLEELSIIDVEDLFNRFLRRISIQDVAFECNMGEIRYSAQMISESFSALLDNVYEEGTEPIPRVSCTPSMKRAYPVGINATNKVICVDGAEFGITNIEEAVHFFSKILNL